MERDLTQGKPSRVLWAFCLPLFGSIIFQQLYNIADSLVAGKFIGDAALAAVSNSYEVTLIFIAFAFGVNIGCSVVVSRYFGAKKYDKMKTAVYTTLIAGAVLCAVLMAIGFLTCSLLLQILKTPEEVFADCELYLYIYIGGVPFLVFYNVATGIFAAMGDSVTPFIFLAVSSVTNVLMDILFVVVFNMGVAGVAWATFICQGVSCVLALAVVLLKLRKIKTEQKAKLFSFSVFGDIAVIAIPSILQQSFISVGNLIIQSIVNSYSTAVMAGYGAAIKLNNLVITSFTTLGNGVSNFTAQNLGAGKYDRIKQGYRAGLVMVALLCVPIYLLYLLAGKYLLLLFMQDASGAAMQEGVLILRILTPFYLIVAMKLVTDGVLRGAGKMWKFMAATFSDLVLRVSFAFLLSYVLQKSLGIWLAWPIGWTVATVISYLCYRFTKFEKAEPTAVKAAAQADVKIEAEVDAEAKK